MSRLFLYIPTKDPMKTADRPMPPHSATKYKGTNGMPPPWGTGGGPWVFKGARRFP